MSVTKSLERMVQRLDFMEKIEHGMIDPQETARCSISMTVICDPSSKGPILIPKTSFAKGKFRFKAWFPDIDPKHRLVSTIDNTGPSLFLRRDLSCYNNLQDSRENTLTEEICCHTNPGSHSTLNVLKRPAHSVCETHEHVEEELYRIRTKRKIEAITNGEAFPRNHPKNTVVRLPQGLDSLIKKNVDYRNLKMMPDNEAILSSQMKTRADIDKDMVEQGEQFVKAAITGDVNWVLLAHFDVFVPNDVQIDGK